MGQALSRRAALQGPIAPNIMRNIASACRAPGFGTGSALTNGTVTEQNCRSQHYNECGGTVRLAQIQWSNWFTNATSEQDANNAITIEGSLEYPVGVYNRITFDNGNTQKVVANGVNILSDTIPLLQWIPKDVPFWVWTWVIVPSGSKWPTLGMSSGDTGESGIGLGSKVMTGGITGSATNLLRPSSINSCGVGFRKCSPGFFGDSIAAGSIDTGFGTRGGIGFIGRSCSGTVPSVVAAVGGTTIHASVGAGKFTRRLDMFQKAGCTHVITNHGVNDLGIPNTAAQLIADHVTISNLVVATGMKYVLCTITPQSSSTQNWNNLASQTAASTTVQKGLFNDAARNGTISPNIYFVIDNAKMTESAVNSNLWGCNTTPNSDFSPYLGPVDTWTITGTPTVNSFTTNSNRPSAGTSWYLGGRVLFTSGVNAGLYVGISSYTASGGTFNFTTALPNAPSAGDTIIAYPVSVPGPGDGLHPTVNGQPGGSGSYGGHIAMTANLQPTLRSWC